MIALGCIADDFTGGTDVAAALRRSGLSVTLLFDVPHEATATPDTDAVVIALKTRTIPAAEAVRHSLDALSWLQDRHVDRVYFKYCSTFDSTEEGNIGPVGDALLRALGEQIALVCPASPEHGRTTYLGHLFVHDQLLADSPMRHHPLTPMRDSRIAVLLSKQTDGAVDRLTLPVIRRGADEVAGRIAELQRDQTRYVVCDAVTEDDLHEIVDGTLHAARLRLWTGGAGLAGALGAALARQGAGDSGRPVHELPPGEQTLVVAGSCSAATHEQVAVAATMFRSYRLEPAVTPDPRTMLKRAAEWLSENWGRGPVLIYSTAGPEEREAAVAAMGPATAEHLEHTLAQLARTAVDLGARRIVVAGGETSGAVVRALGVSMVEVAGEADRGVPWCLAPTATGPIALLLKSGNFGSHDLLVRATKEHL
ncbi:3-oxo-tetronate kinase [Nocardioides sp. CER19]|uniref:3-oxo-tetronate kinase n=1 Tax=Nocardioides sp. CER19 TaxID=3038538 RepID=UPI00244809C9|nr:3-oxo-tetronate kinase [Nocardioides sp. CER19]MDH2416097.1 four-carbon acid sugar kinase family protein [Nocardioides sp. CER19]